VIADAPKQDLELVIVDACPPWGSDRLVPERRLKKLIFRLRAAREPTGAQRAKPFQWLGPHVGAHRCRRAAASGGRELECQPAKTSSFFSEM
jgi:hypothetical protein